MFMQFCCNRFKSGPQNFPYDDLLAVRAAQVHYKGTIGDEK